VVRLDSVSKVYRRGPATIAAVQTVTLRVASGEFVALMGPSGSGKSTLLNLIGGLDRPTDGDVLIDECSTRHFSEADWTRLRRERIGIVFQFFNLLPALTAQENVALPLLLRGDRDADQRTKACLEAVGMAHRAGHRPSELSGGEQQRVSLARALVHRPAHDIILLMKTLARDNGQTVILATHSREAGSEADRIVTMRDGRVDGEASS